MCFLLLFLCFSFVFVVFWFVLGVTQKLFVLQLFVYVSKTLAKKMGELTEHVCMFFVILLCFVFLMDKRLSHTIAKSKIQNINEDEIICSIKQRRRQRYRLGCTIHHYKANTKNNHTRDYHQQQHHQYHVRDILVIKIPANSWQAYTVKIDN